MTDLMTLVRPHANAPARVLLAGEDDDHRSSTRATLDHHGRVQVVAETASRDTLADTAGALCPDLIVLCAGPLPSAGVVRVLAERCPGTHVLVLGRAERHHPPTTAAALQAAADCLRAMAQNVAADANPADLMSALRPADAAERPTARALTGREREVLQAVADGLSSKEVAARLSISVRTVESHRNQIMKKVGLRSVAGLTKFAIRMGLVTLS